MSEWPGRSAPTAAWAAGCCGHEAGAVVKVKGDPAHPANPGDICAKAVHLPRPSAPTHGSSIPTCGPVATCPRARAVARPPRCRRRPPRDRARARPRRGGRLRLGPAPHRGVLLRQARQGLSRHQQLRHQLAPLHGVRRGGLRALAGGGRAARRLRGHRIRGLLLLDRHQHRRLPPDHLQAHPPAQARRAGHGDGDRGRPALDGDGGHRRPPPAAPARLGQRLLNAMLHVLWRRELLDRDFIDARTGGWDACGRSSRDGRRSAAR